MPGFFDIIFGSKPVEPEAPKPKKVKKVKIKKVETNPLEESVQGLRDEVTELQNKMKGFDPMEGETDEN